MNGYEIESTTQEMDSLWYELYDEENSFIKSRYGELIGELSNLAEILVFNYQMLEYPSDMPYMPNVNWRDLAISVMLEDLSQTLIEETYSFDPDELKERELEREQKLTKLNRKQLLECFADVYKYLEYFYELLEAYLFIKGIQEATSEDRSLSFGNMKWEE